jgi:hypothetical protein
VRLARLSRSLHKWLAVLVGAQALLWIVSGFYMVIVDIDFIHGDTLVRNLENAPPPSDVWHPVAEVQAQYAGIEQLRIKGLPGGDRPLYEVHTADGIVLLDAMSGVRLSPLDRERIADLARHYYAGSGQLVDLELLTGEAPLEIQGRALPLWRAGFDDWHATTLYVHPETGDLVTRRHRAWRWFDAMWMLHIMDYDTRSDVNNLVLRVSTVAGLVFIASGGWLVWFSFRRRRRPEI